MCVVVVLETYGKLQEQMANKRSVVNGQALCFTFLSLNLTCVVH